MLNADDIDPTWSYLCNTNYYLFYTTTICSHIMLWRCCGV